MCLKNSLVSVQMPVQFYDHLTTNYYYGSVIVINLSMSFISLLDKHVINKDLDLRWRVILLILKLKRLFSLKLQSSVYGEETEHSCCDECCR